MNKGGHRHEGDHISRIQANLKQMKDEVNEYLKRQHNDQVPPILRARHYLILTYMNDLTNPTQPQIDPARLKRELSSERLGCNIESDGFEPMRTAEQQQKQKHQKNKIVKQKRPSIGIKKTNQSVQQDINCLLPNICTLNLECNSSAQRYDNKMQITRRNSLERKSNQTLSSPQPWSQIDNTRRFHSIDLNQLSHISDMPSLKTTHNFKITTRPIPAAFNREHMSNGLNKSSFNSRVEEYLSHSIKDTVIVPNHSSILPESPKLEKAQSNPEESKFETLLEVDKEKKALVKRRSHAKPHQNNQIFSPRVSLKKDLSDSNKTFLFEKKPSKPEKHYKPRFIPKQVSQCSPWQAGDDIQKQKAIYLLENQIF